MNNKSPIFKLIIVFGIFIFIILFISIFWMFITKDDTATLEILVTPSDSKILINNKQYINGTYKIKPGKYSVNISKNDFTSYSGNITTEKDKTTKLYQAIFQSDGSYSWYISHNKDDILLTTIGDKETESIQESLVNKYPILKYIPYTEQSNGIKYKIDIQMNNNELTYVSIYFNTCSSSVSEIYKTEALNWIKFKGINPDDYVIKYSSLCN